MPFQLGNPGRPPTDPIARFWSKVDRSGGPGACWPYLGAKVWDGYGRFRLPNRTVRAHRYAFEITRGPIPDGLQLDHLCQNRPCCNPAHLEPVTLIENVRRGDQSGRKRRTSFIRPRVVTPIEQPEQGETLGASLAAGSMTPAPVSLPDTAMVP